MRRDLAHPFNVYNKQSKLWPFSQIFRIYTLTAMLPLLLPTDGQCLYCTSSAQILCLCKSGWIGGWGWPRLSCARYAMPIRYVQLVAGPFIVNLWPTNSAGEQTVFYVPFEKVYRQRAGHFHWFPTIIYWIDAYFWNDLISINYHHNHHPQCSEWVAWLAAAVKGLPHARLAYTNKKQCNRRMPQNKK